MDFAIDNDGTGWRLSIVDGDLVRLEEDSPEDVAQRVIYALMTWRGESPYDQLAGVPYLTGVFGYEPVPGIVALLRDVVARVEGVDEIVGDPVFELARTRELNISISIRVGDALVPLQLQLSPTL